MKIKTAELTGGALDWAVAKCELYNVGVKTREDVLAAHAEAYPDELQRARELFADYKAEPCFVSESGWKHTCSSKLSASTWCGYLTFSRNWLQGGPIIERERISINYDASGRWSQGWRAFSNSAHVTLGETPLIAAMRCYVASKLGDEVEIPDELAGE